tara:strand:+ start:1836 stop:2939 length:1104 start_codon:yes stop_codon:yes gene_type:complete
MKINILLPYKEQFDKKKLSSVSITVLNNFNHSKFKKETRIFGKEVKEPAIPDNFIGITNSLNIFKSKNLHLAKIMCLYINKDTDNNQLVEIHNRPVLFNFVLKKIKKKFPVNIFFHNNPLDMAGSKTLFERKMIVKNAYYIFCVSKYVKDKFLVGFSFIPSNIHVLYNGVEKNLKKFPFKKNEILFVGRLVEEKGVRLFVEALENLAHKLPDWKFCIIGSSHLGMNKKMSLFAKNYSKKFLAIGKQAYFTGYLSHDEVQKKMRDASIVVVPSLWDEPFGLVVAEAMSNGAAIIASFSGGIPEIIGKNGIVIEEINKTKLENAILFIASDKKSLKKYQKLSWKNFKHTAIESSKKLDNLRSAIFKISI